MPDNSDRNEDLAGSPHANGGILGGCLETLSWRKTLKGREKKYISHTWSL